MKGVAISIKLSMSDNSQAASRCAINQLNKRISRNLSIFTSVLFLVFLQQRKIENFCFN